MKIEDINFETVCCGNCHYAEIETQTGFAAIERAIDTGEYRVRLFGADKMPTGEVLGFHEAKFADWLKRA